MSAAALLGAEGAYVGTRFLVCEESPCSPAAQQVIIDTKAEDLIRIKSTYGLVRMIQTERSLRCEQMVHEGATQQEIDDEMRVVAAMWGAMRNGNIDEYQVGMSNAVNLITGVVSAAQIVEDIASAFKIYAASDHGGRLRFRMKKGAGKPFRLLGTPRRCVRAELDMSDQSDLSSQHCCPYRKTPGMVRCRKYVVSKQGAQSMLSPAPMEGLTGYVFRMKEWWAYARFSFADPSSVHRAFRKVRKIGEYEAAANRVFRSEKLAETTLYGREPQGGARAVGCF